MSYWKIFWQDKQSSLQRHCTDDFHNKLAKERLFHLGGGGTLLDFACGAGEVLKFMAPSFSRIVAADFSPSLINNAKELMAQHNIDNITFIEADDKTVWQNNSDTFDAISAAGVLQYMTAEQVSDFIACAKQRLNRDGMIALFDILDPLIYPLFAMGAFQGKVGKTKMIARYAKSKALAIGRALRGKPGSDMGYVHYPQQIEHFALQNGLRMERVSSIYHEYRYHALLTL